MKKPLLSTAVLTLMSASALAADLPSRKAPILPPPPPPMWTGFYAGLNAGYGFGTNSNTQSAAVEGAVLTEANQSYSYSQGTGLAMTGVGSQNQSGFIGGGQIGYNYQWDQNFVIGIEADMQGAGIRGASRNVGSSGAEIFYPPNPPYVDIASSIGANVVRGGVDWMGTVRGRLGYLFTPTMLAYATGGLSYGGAYANVDSAAFTYTQHYFVPGQFTYDFNRTFIGGGTRSSTLVGWNVGGGLEWMFMPNWSLKAEGIYWNMGSMALPTYTVGAAPRPSNFPSGSAFDAHTVGATRVNYQGVIARLGVNYHFNFGGAAPVVAKY